MAFEQATISDLAAELERRLTPVVYRAYRKELDRLAFKIGSEQQDADVGAHAYR